MKTADLNYLGIQKDGVPVNLNKIRLIEEALAQQEGHLTDTGALSVFTGKYTGRSPDDRYIVDNEASHDVVEWGKVNVPISQNKFDRLYNKVVRYLEGKKIYVYDGWAGADEEFRLPLRVVTEAAYQNLFVNNLFITPPGSQKIDPEFTVVAAPYYKCDPEADGVHSEAAIIIDLKKKVILVAGSQYCGEIKKSIFSVMNYLLPDKGVFPMHCSANMGDDGDTAIFFGLSGTGKTTLSANPKRRLIGDDEHGWGPNGVFNFEGGCYAKCIDLTREREPEIWDAIKTGAVVENVVYDENGTPDYSDSTYTENTRTGYPLNYISNAVIPSIGGQPSTVVFLTADAFGVLPPISKLDKNQAMYYFVSGYTSKLAGTERGITEPQATFSTCFAAPFLPLPAARYAELLGERIDEYDCDVYLVNTGWAGGQYGVGKRMDLPLTRAMVDAAIDGSLKNVEYKHDPVFNVDVPTSCPGVPDEKLDARGMWEDSQAYDKMARKLADAFIENFRKYDNMPEEVVSAGPVPDEQ
ncbi:MAG: phosphoenolpyruvate carboxykinase (ATP) [Eubacteriaceae bacterium]|jgi:phosphoenolpyruvate carboxykinase (ATP)